MLTNSEYRKYELSTYFFSYYGVMSIVDIINNELLRSRKTKNNFLHHELIYMPNTTSILSWGESLNTTLIIHS